MDRSRAFEELTGGANERPALLVFVEAGGFADEQQGAIGVALTGYGVRASLVQRAFFARGNLCADGFKLLTLFFRGHASTSARPRSEGSPVERRRDGGRLTPGWWVGAGLTPRPPLHHVERGSLPSPRPSPMWRGGVGRTYPLAPSLAGKGNGGRGRGAGVVA